MGMNFKSLFISACFAFATQATLAATIQVGTDAENLHACGSLTSLSVSGESVVITGPDVESATCLGSTATGSSAAVNKSVSVNGGSSTAIDLSSGATVTLPFESPGATIVSQPTQGSIAALNGTVATYSANATETATTDSFTYRLNDATVDNTNTATVSISIAAGGTGGGGSCVSAGNIVCKGVISPLIQYGSPAAGTGDSADRNHWVLPLNTIHVYEFTYYKSQTGSSVGSIQFVADQGSPSKIMKISTSAGDVAAESTGCYVAYYTAAAWSDTNTPSVNYCELHDGTTYFLNIKTTAASADQYLLFTQN